MIGGEASGALTSIEQATIDGEGDLGSFTLAATSLATPRTGAASAVVGDAVYLIGGSDGTRDLTSVERAPIAADGTLQAFASVADLESARQSPAVTVVDNFLYVLGGSNRASGPPRTGSGAHRCARWGSRRRSRNSQSREPRRAGISRASR